MRRIEQRYNLDAIIRRDLPEFAASCIPRTTALALKNRTRLANRLFGTPKHWPFTDRLLVCLRPLMKADAETFHDAGGRGMVDLYESQQLERLDAELFTELSDWLLNISSRMTGSRDAAVIAHPSLRKALAEVLEEENPKQPLSDAAIASVLATKKGLGVARRTIAKYRKQLGIPRSSKRRRKVHGDSPNS